MKRKEERKKKKEKSDAIIPQIKKAETGKADVASYPFPDSFHSSVFSSSLIVLLLTFDSPTIISGRGVGLLVNAESDPDL